MLNFTHEEEKRKLEVHCNPISHLSDGQKFKGLTTYSVGEAVWETHTFIFCCCDIRQIYLVSATVA